MDVLDVAGTLLLDEVTLALHLLQAPLQGLDEHHCLTQFLVHCLVLGIQGKKYITGVSKCTKGTDWLCTKE